MMTDTGTTAVGMIVETIGAETNGAENSGVENKPVEKPCAIVIGNTTRIGPCGTATRTIAATIVASACTDEGTTFRALLAKARSRSAIEMLNAERLSLTEITERPGFSDLSSFSQAFKRWRGVAPSHFSLRKSSGGVCRMTNWSDQ